MKNVGNIQNPWRTGILALHLKDPEEQALLDNTLDSIERDFRLNGSSDQMQAQMAAYYFVQWQKAVRDNMLDMSAIYDRLMRKNLNCLKITREKREGTEIKISSPADWAASLMAECKKREIGKKKLDKRGVKK